MTQILPFLYIGDVDTSADFQLLKRLGITGVINVTQDLPNHWMQHLDYLHIPVNDAEYANISDWFNEASQFIERHRNNNGGVLVHCWGGISRSTSVCIAFLMYHKRMCLDEAFDFIAERKQQVLPNMCFLAQLKLYERKLKISPREPVDYYSYEHTSSTSDYASDLSPPSLAPQLAPPKSTGTKLPRKARPPPLQLVISTSTPASLEGGSSESDDSFYASTSSSYHSFPNTPQLISTPL